MKLSKFFIGLAIGIVSLGNGAYAAKDAGHGHDYRTFHADGTIDYGEIGDSYTSDLVMYLAGNQFMVMEELIKDFQSKNPDIRTVYVETIPPGQIFKNQLLKQGEIDGQKTAMNPDLFASVNINHLRNLKKKGLMSEHMIYIHNKLELMVAAGNPKNIKGPEDLGRDDIVQSHPNPLTEGIFKFYGSEMLKDLGLHEKVTGGKECKSCWAVEGKTWFTSRHHRETPHRIEQGDRGITCQARGSPNRWCFDSGALQQTGQGRLRDWPDVEWPQYDKRPAFPILSGKQRGPGYLQQLRIPACDHRGTAPQTALTHLVRQMYLFG